MLLLHQAVRRGMQATSVAGLRVHTDRVVFPGDDKRVLTVKPVTFEGSECRLMFSDGAMLAVKNATLAPYGIWIAQPAGAGVHLECAGHAAPLPWPPAQPKLQDGRHDHREDSSIQSRQDHREDSSIQGRHRDSRRLRTKTDDRCVYGKDMDVVPAPGAAPSKNAVMADPDACCAACAANPECVVANYDIADKTCWEKVKP